MLKIEYSDVAMRLLSKLQKYSQPGENDVKIEVVHSKIEDAGQPEVEKLEMEEDGELINNLEADSSSEEMNESCNSSPRSEASVHENQRKCTPEKSRNLLYIFTFQISNMIRLQMITLLCIHMIQYLHNFHH